jgi:hypothetical protein
LRQFGSRPSYTLKIRICSGVRKFARSCESVKGIRVNAN